jgi:hypothetical protein
MAFKNGFSFVWATRKRRPTNTHPSANPDQRWIQIDPVGMTREQLLVRVMYESGNAVQNDEFLKVRADRSGVKSAAAYADRIIEAESLPVVWASMKALEAGLQYDRRLDAFVRAATKPDPAVPGGLTWKSDKHFNEVLAVATKAAGEATAMNKEGKTVPVHEIYESQWLPP